MISFLSAAHGQWNAEYFQHSLVIFAFAIILMGFLTLTVGRSHSFADTLYHILSNFHQKRNRTIKRWTIGTWIAGILIYVIGFYTPKDSIGFLERFFYSISVFLHAFMSSLEMFVSKSDLIEVNHVLHTETLYMVPFMLIHFCAIFLSVGFILSFISYRWRVQLKLKSWLNQDDKDLYVMWGMNSPSLNLAESIKGKQKMIFITEDDHETEQNHKLSFSHLLGSGHAGAVYLSKAEGYNALVMAYDEKTTLQRLRKFAEKKKNLHFIFFSEDETFNLSRASKILASEQFYGLKDYVYTYCHARKRMLNLALLEELGPEEHIQNASSKHLKLVDSSVLAIQRLKADPEAQPVNFMELETVKVGNAQKTTGAVKGAFHAMVIGFSETGQEALSFLYEYGAFVGTDGNAAPFRCVVLDKDMSQIEGTYYAKRPALKTKENIILKTAAVGSKAFWAAVDEEICQLNYVIIALGDDQLNTSVAVDLYNHILLKNGDIPRHFVIYVRLNKRQRKEIKGISSFYFGQSNTDSVIRFFGSEEEVYSDKFVINNEDEQKALQFANVYDTFNEKYKAKKTKNEVVKEKEKQQPQAQPKPKSKSDKLEFLLKQRNARRAFIQNLSNARHILTKVALLTNQMTDWENLDALQQLVRTPNVSDFKGQYFYRMNNANEEISPELADYYSGLMLNVARCEHERWIRSHEMLGYTPFERPEMRGKDIAQKHHDCMLPWNDLLNRWENGGEEVDDEVLCYDYNVVETSIHLYVAEHAAELEQWKQQQKTIKH